MSRLRPEYYVLLALLALLPAAAFGLGRADPRVALSAVCVLLIAGSLYLMFGEADAPGPAA